MSRKLVYIWEWYNSIQIVLEEEAQSEEKRYIQTACICSICWPEGIKVHNASNPNNLDLINKIPKDIVVWMKEFGPSVDSYVKFDVKQKKWIPLEGYELAYLKLRGALDVTH